MKKSIFGNAIALLAAGAMIFGALGCDDGNGEYVPENPTTYLSLADSSTNDASVTAKWDFSVTTAFSDLSASDTTLEGDLAPSSGEGATLTCSYVKGKYDSTNIRFQLANVTTSLAALSSSYYWTLKLDGQSNIVIEADGAGPATAARLVALAPKGADPLVYKDGMGSAGKVKIQLEGAPAGEYTLYTNGVRIYSIDASATAAITKVGSVAAVKVASLDSEGKNPVYYDDSVEEPVPLSVTMNTTTQLQVMGYENEDCSDAGTDYSVGAAYYSYAEDVATVAAGGVVTGHSIGDTVNMRARVGREYKDFTVKVVAGTNTIDVTNFLAAKDVAFEKDFKIHIGTARFTKAAKAILVAGADVSNYVKASTTLKDYKAVVKSAATNGDVTVTVSATGETEESGKIDFTIPKDMLETNNAGDKPDTDVIFETSYSVKKGTFVTLFDASTLPNAQIIIESAAGTANAKLTDAEKTAIAKAYKPTVVGTYVEVTEDVKVTASDALIKAGYNGTGEELLSLWPMTDGSLDGNGTFNGSKVTFKRGLAFKNAKLEKGAEVLSITLKVKPKSGKVKLSTVGGAQDHSLFCGGGNGHFVLRTTVGETVSENDVTINKNSKTEAVTIGTEISEETTITLKVLMGAEKASSLGMQDLQLFFETVE